MYTLFIFVYLCLSLFVLLSATQCNPAQPSHFSPRSMRFSYVITELLLLKLRKILTLDHVPGEGGIQLRGENWRHQAWKGKALIFWEAVACKHNMCYQTSGAFGMSKPGSITSLYPCQNARVEHNLKAPKCYIAGLNPRYKIWFLWIIPGRYDQKSKSLNPPKSCDFDFRSLLLFAEIKGRTHLSSNHTSGRLL